MIEDNKDQLKTFPSALSIVFNQRFYTKSY